MALNRRRSPAQRARGCERAGGAAGLDTGGGQSDPPLRERLRHGPTPSGLSEALIELRAAAHGYRDKFSIGMLPASQLPATPGMLVTVSLRNDGISPVTPITTYCDLYFALSPNASHNVSCAGYTPDAWCLFQGQATELCDYHGRLTQAGDCSIAPGQAASLTSLLEGVDGAGSSNTFIRVYVGSAHCDNGPHACVFNEAARLR